MKKLILTFYFFTGLWSFDSAKAERNLCSYEKIAQIPLRNIGGYIIGDFQINGQMVSLIIDTGSEGSLISLDGASRLHLPVDPGQKTIILGSKGGSKTVQNVFIRNMHIGTYNLGSLSIPVGNLPQFPRIKPAISGLIGGDILSNFDVEFSLKTGKLNLWEVNSHSLLCMVPPFWQEKGHITDLDKKGFRVFTKVRIDQFPLEALIDSGARSRIVALQKVKEMGIHEDELATRPGGLASSIGSKEVVYHWYQFKRFEIGGQVEIKPTLTVSPLHDEADMLIGSDWFALNKIWISYKREKLYFINNKEE
ncbi:retroviral-like aspartic protease family protein [Commensalibacter melissae]|uniref:retroviral-like aspartic protease family protein n=1 Tax=Commensalibacter melissae TaxID=2070537 RepID=UPI0012D9D905|nr:retroviral-like aspartic protease family protein [Commensalibacter melissae]MUG77847.1 hypothetical protein [Commensalibacter melissae]